MTPARAITVVTLTVTPLLAQAQWDVTLLTPPGGQQARVAVGHGGQQAGSYMVGESERACMWSGTSSSWIDLHPWGSPYSIIRHITGSAQYGTYSEIYHRFRAVKWSGSAWEQLDMHPPGATDSWINGGTEGYQVGGVYRSSVSGAAMWFGTAESWVSLHPKGALTSGANDAFGEHQVGYVWTDVLTSAALWSGTAESWIPLNPEGALSSEAEAVYEDRQVGYARFGDVFKASLWSGSAESWIDLSPPGYHFTWANDIWKDTQVGYFRTPAGIEHAALWRGSAESMVDLHSFMPPELHSGNSRAESIWHHEGRTYIGGSAEGHPVLWASSVPEPSLLAGLLVGIAGFCRVRGRSAG